ncbi:hypothetical protein B0H66DRAFT_273500 [Apodospora peruviana]|uniref:F-box domain-containing protein n=1 Tax=Apodospora peruviana TaxID=516989 RepID=A0AAE0I0L6_9PEZI|nr:hypothetical protein B0H66DRAFT_273500 [Apodospora peruviana]
MPFFLLSLPNELIVGVAEAVENEYTLACQVAANKHLYYLLNECVLYQGNTETRNSRGYYRAVIKQCCRSSKVSAGRCNSEPFSSAWLYSCGRSVRYPPLMDACGHDYLKRVHLMLSKWAHAELTYLNDPTLDLENVVAFLFALRLYQGDDKAIEELVAYGLLPDRLDDLTPVFLWAALQFLCKPGPHAHATF